MSFQNSKDMILYETPNSELRPPYTENLKIFISEFRIQKSIFSVLMLCLDLDVVTVVETETMKNNNTTKSNEVQISNIESNI